MIRVTILITLAVSVDAYAQSASDKAVAEALYEDGRRLMNEGKVAEACAKFEESQKRDPGLGTMLRLGDCYEKLGKLASAWAMFREGEAVAQKQADGRAKMARERADKLEPRLPKIEIVVPAESAVDGLEVKLDGVTATVATRFPIDPGEHVVEASAPGRAPWKETVTAEEGKPITVTIPVLPEAAAPSAPAEPGAAPVAESPSSPAPEDVDEGGGLGTRKTIALVVAGAGVVALGVGLGFGLKARSDWKATDAHCDEMNRCDDEGIELADSADSAATIANISAGVGLAAVAAGAVLWLTAPKEDDTSSARLHLAPSHDGWALVLSGGF